MGKTASNNEQRTDTEKRRPLRSKLIPLLTLLAVIAIVVATHLIYGRHQERLVGLGNYVYGGAFVISIIGNATIILPGAVLAILSNIGILLLPTTGLAGPIMVGLAGGAGAAIGEMTGYAAGYSGRAIVQGRQTYSRVEERTRRWGAIAIFVFSVFPFVFDLVGIAAGALRFPLWKFLLLCWLGRTLLYVTTILLVAFGWTTLLPFSG